MRRSVLILMMAMGFVMASCQPMGPEVIDLSQKPADFSIGFFWSVGALPPPYHYSYQILVSAEGKGQFIYQEGYEGEDAKEPITREFTLSQEQLQGLYEMMLQKDLLRETWEKGEILLGAPSTAMKITAAGKSYEVPDDASMTTTDRKAVNEVYDFLRALLPQSIWDELAIWRQQADSPAVSPSS